MFILCPDTGCSQIATSRVDAIRFVVTLVLRLLLRFGGRPSNRMLATIVLSCLTIGAAISAPTSRPHEGEGPFPLRFQRSYLSGGIDQGGIALGWSTQVQARAHG